MIFNINIHIRSLTLHYSSCHPRHIRNNIVLSLGQKIIGIVSGNKEQHLNKFRYCLIQPGHPEEVLDYTMIKLFSRSFKNQNESSDYITFVQTCNPNTKFKKNITNSSLNGFHNNSLKNALEKKKPLLETRQAKSSENLLIGARFDVVPKPIAPSKNIKGVFYIVTIILTLAKSLNLNLNLADTIFRNTTANLTVKAETQYVS